MPTCRLLSSLELISVDSETACHPDRIVGLVSYGTGYHAYCLSAGCFGRKLVDFVT